MRDMYEDCETNNDPERLTCDEAKATMWNILIDVKSGQLTVRDAYSELLRVHHYQPPIKGYTPGSYRARQKPACAHDWEYRWPDGYTGPLWLCKTCGNKKP